MAKAPRYRKFEVQAWVRGSFTRLSPLKPSGQALWLYLTTNPDTVNVPGIYRAGEAQLAEALAWPMPAFRRHWRELEAEGMAEADWSARVVWLPNAARVNRPESPNVILSWHRPWDEIPDCEIKVRAWHSLRTFAGSLGEGFAKAFDEVCRQPFGQISAHHFANQEQEQEQEQESPLTPQRGAKASPLLRRFRRGGSPPDGHSSWDSFFGSLAVSLGCSGEAARDEWVRQQGGAA